VNSLQVDIYGLRLYHLNREEILAFIGYNGNGYLHIRNLHFSGQSLSSLNHFEFRTIVDVGFRSSTQPTRLQL
jgi:hypothetical protein